MDKILLTAFLSALAGFITAIISIVKLVNEKESKISEYRQAWTDSARQNLADLIGLIHAQAGTTANLRSNSKSFSDLLKFEPSAEESAKIGPVIDYVKDSMKEQQSHRREMIKEIYITYSKTRLHFKVDDLSFARIEHTFSRIMEMFDKLVDEQEKEERAKIKEKIHAAADELTTFSRLILKTEWEIVKKGEKAFQTTKQWTIYGSIVMLFVLLAIGTHAVISMWKENIRNTPVQEEKIAPMQNFKPSPPP